MHPTYSTYWSRVGAERDRAGVLGPIIGGDGRRKGRCGGWEACEVGVVVLLGTPTICPRRITVKVQGPARPIHHASELTEPEGRGRRPRAEGNKQTDYTRHPNVRKGKKEREVR